MDCREIGLREAYELLCGLQDVHILIHRSPDGDCIGGGYALYRILKAAGIRSRVICADPIPALYHDITDGITFEEFEPKCLISVDVSDRKLFGELPDSENEGDILLCIDHHISNTHYAQNLLLNAEASAACEVLFAMAEECGIPITRELALCLYIGMATDTGCFQYSNAGAAAFAAVGKLKALFPDLPYARINREMFVLKSRGRLVLDVRLMQNMRLSADGRAALIYLPRAWMEELGVADSETDGVANLPMQMIGAEIGISVKQQSDGSFRVSLRGGEHADVSALAAQFGGGGHIKASGCSFPAGNPEDVCSALLHAAEEALKCLQN